jgi:hypothetical protein
MNKSIATFALLVAGALFGCQNNGSGGSADASPNSPKPVGTPTATPAATNSIKLKSGGAPFTYVVGPGGPLHIVDATTGKTVVSKVVAAPNAVVMIDDAKGISIANTVVKAGPLPAGHQYELWLDQQ